MCRIWESTESVLESLGSICLVAMSSRICTAELNKTPFKYGMESNIETSTVSLRSLSSR